MTTLRIDNGKSKIWSACYALLLLLSGCGGGGGGSAPGPSSSPIYTLQEAQQPAKWTILVYLDADNDLEDAAINNFNQMEAIGSTRDVHVIVQMDRKSGDDSRNARWTDTRRYLITKDSDRAVMHSLRLDQRALGELDMADPNTLRDFVQWGKSQFPAEHYMLVVWDHGSGWTLRALAARPRYKAIAADDTSGNEMNVTEMAATMAGLRVDVLAFDACCMQQLEVAYELRNCADYLVASASTEPAAGYDYSRVLANVPGTTTPTQMCQMLVRQFALEYPNPQRNITLSAVSLARIGKVATAASGLAAVLNPRAAALSAELAAARKNSLDYAPSEEYYSHDLIDYADRCAAAVGSAAEAARSALQGAVDSAVIYSTHNSDMPSAHGLGVYVPAPTQYNARYPELALSRDTQWDEWIRAQRE